MQVVELVGTKRDTPRTCIAFDLWCTPPGTGAPETLFRNGRCFPHPVFHGLSTRGVDATGGHHAVPSAAPTTCDAFRAHVPAPGRCLLRHCRLSAPTGSILCVFSRRFCSLCSSFCSDPSPPPPPSPFFTATPAVPVLVLVGAISPRSALLGPLASGARRKSSSLPWLAKGLPAFGCGSSHREAGRSGARLAPALARSSHFRHRFHSSAHSATT